MEPADLPHCDAQAEYIFLGKSYCAQHIKIRSDEVMEARRKKKEATPMQ